MSSRRAVLTRPTVTSKGVLRSSDFHSLDVMSSHNLSGHHSWLNAGRSELRSSLLQYQDCKRRAPSTTSACILVPKDRRGPWICWNYIALMDSGNENTHWSVDTCMEKWNLP
jgi:hypothetical protein